MFRKLISTTLIFCTILLLLIPTKADAVKIPNGTGPSIFEEIKNGGYILYVRHGEATHGQDQPGLSFDNCATQRNLSETGRSQALMLGNIFRKKMIPIQYPINASPYCRTRETAEIAFGQLNVLVNPMLATIVKFGKEGSSVEEKQNILAELKKILEIPPDHRRNKIIIGHSVPSGQALGEIPNMGTVVIRPKGQGNGFEIVARISLEEFIRWSNL